METSMAVTICATVCRVWNCCLLVCDQCTNQMVIVHANNACHFCPGDHVCIHFDGAMTRSMPPQIHGACVEFLRCC